VAHEDLGLGSEHHPPARGPEQLDTDFLLKLAQLLGYRGGTETQRLGHAGEGASDLEFAQQAKPSHIEHRIILSVSFA